jgi:hypothetical protein
LKHLSDRGILANFICKDFVSLKSTGTCVVAMGQLLVKLLVKSYEMRSKGSICNGCIVSLDLTMRLGIVSLKSMVIPSDAAMCPVLSALDAEVLQPEQLLAD